MDGKDLYKAVAYRYGVDEITAEQMVRGTREIKQEPDPEPEEYGWWLERAVLDGVPVVILNSDVPLPLQRLYCLQDEWDRMSNKQKKDLHCISLDWRYYA